jgi:hypothetical protein
LLEKNIEKTIEGTYIGNIFLKKTSIAQEIRARIDKWDCIELKSFCPAKEAITRLKQQPTDLEKIFAQNSSDKGLLSRICKELQKSNTKKEAIQLLNGQMN